MKLTFLETENGGAFPFPDSSLGLRCRDLQPDDGKFAWRMRKDHRIECTLTRPGQAKPWWVCRAPVYDHSTRDTVLLVSTGAGCFEYRNGRLWRGRLRSRAEKTRSHARVLSPSGSPCSRSAPAAVAEQPRTPGRGRGRCAPAPEPKSATPDDDASSSWADICRAVAAFMLEPAAGA